MAFFGGWVDEILMRIIEVFNSLPGLLITMLIMVVLGNGMWTMLLLWRLPVGQDQRVRLADW